MEPGSAKPMFKVRLPARPPANGTPQQLPQGLHQPYTAQQTPGAASPALAATPGPHAATQATPRTKLVVKMPRPLGTATPASGNGHAGHAAARTGGVGTPAGALARTPSGAGGATPASSGLKFRIKGLKAPSGAGAAAANIAAQVAQQVMAQSKANKFTIKLPDRPTIALPSSRPLPPVHAHAAGRGGHGHAHAYAPRQAARPAAAPRVPRANARAVSRAQAHVVKEQARMARKAAADERRTAAAYVSAQRPPKRPRGSYSYADSDSLAPSASGLLPGSPSASDWGLPGSPLGSEFTGPASSGGGAWGASEGTPLKGVPKQRLQAPAVPLPPPTKDDMIKLVDKIQVKDKARVFAAPVTADVAPDYHEVVKQPMDFSTLRTKLDEGAYDTWAALGADLELMFRNGMAYNPEGNPIHTTAKGMLEVSAVMIGLAETGVTNFRGRTAGITRRMNAQIMRQEAEVRRQENEAERQAKAQAGYEGRTRGVTVEYGEELLGSGLMGGEELGPGDRPEPPPKRKYTKRRRLIPKDMHRQIDQQLAGMTIEDGARSGYKELVAPESFPAAAWAGLAGGANAEGLSYAAGGPVLRLAGVHSVGALPLDGCLSSLARFAAGCGGKVAAMIRTRMCSLVPVPGRAPAPPPVAAAPAPLLQAMAAVPGGVRPGGLGMPTLHAMQQSMAMQQQAQQQQAQQQHQQQAYVQALQQQQQQQQQQHFFAQQMALAQQQAQQQAHQPQPMQVYHAM